MGRCAGSFAEYSLMDAREALAVPKNLSWEEAGSVPLAFMVVHDMLIAQGKLKAGEWLLVTGISAGVGVAALQTAKALGAKVIGTSGSAEKLEKLKAIGLEVGIRTRVGDFADAAMKATGGKGVNLVVNNVGGSVFAETIRALAYEGRHATVGYVDRGEDPAARRPGVSVLRGARSQELHGIELAPRQDRGAHGLKAETVLFRLDPGFLHDLAPGF